MTTMSHDAFPLRYWELLWYICIAFLGLAGNMAVIYVIWRSDPRFRSASYNRWLLSLATADLLLSIITTPNYILSTSVYNHPGGKQGDVLCRIFTGYTAMSCLAEASIYHLVGISIERLRVVVNPLSSRATESKHSTNTKIGIAWILAFLVQFPPNFVYTKYSYDHPTIGNHCTAPWESNLAFGRIVFVVVFLMDFLLPLFVLVYTSMSIRRHLNSQGKAFANKVMGLHKHKGRRFDSRKTRTSRMLSMVVAAFCICWTPHWIMCFSLQFANSIFWNKAYFQIGLLLGISNSVVNCVLYALLSDEFRRQFYATFPNITRLLNRLSLTNKNEKTGLIEPLVKPNV